MVSVEQPPRLRSLADQQHNRRAGVSSARRAGRATIVAVLFGAGLAIASGAVASAAPDSADNASSASPSPSRPASARPSSARVSKTPAPSASSSPVRISPHANAARGSASVVTLRLPNETPTSTQSDPELSTPARLTRAAQSALEGARRNLDAVRRNVETAIAGPAQPTASDTATPTALPSPGQGVYGNPAKYATYWKRQRGNTCVLMSTAQVIGQLTGKMPDPTEIIVEASTTQSATYTRGRFYSQLFRKWVDRSGNIYDPLNDEYVFYTDAMNLLTKHGITSTATYYTSGQGDRALQDMVTSLSQGQSVIVSIHGRVTASIVGGWTRPGGFIQGNHAVTVLGVDVTNKVVYINDTALAQGQGMALSYEDFLAAWKPSRFMMVTARLANTQNQSSSAAGDTLAA